MVLGSMTSPFCEKCGTLITPKTPKTGHKKIFWCPNCRYDIEIEDTTFFQEHVTIQHTPQEQTRILENEPPPVPKIFSQTYEQRKKKRCHHPNAVFQGFYQFSRGDEASRKYWYCSDCGQVFRFSGRMEIKPKRKVISERKNRKRKEKSEKSLKSSLEDF
jgi:DNA-directed RNA polymerase subunit M/transcription elongation factor TFIIS